MKTNKNFWDCDCMVNYIHAKTDKVCILCGCVADEQPDSHASEVEEEFKTHEEMIWHDMRLVRISTVPGFGSWLYGQTMPLVEDDVSPYDWAYYSDYDRYVKGILL